MTILKLRRQIFQIGFPFLLASIFSVSIFASLPPIKERQSYLDVSALQKKYPNFKKRNSKTKNILKDLDLSHGAIFLDQQGVLRFWNSDSRRYFFLNSRLKATLAPHQNSRSELFKRSVQSSGKKEWKHLRGWYQFDFENSELSMHTTRPANSKSLQWKSQFPGNVTAIQVNPRNSALLGWSAEKKEIYRLIWGQGREHRKNQLWIQAWSPDSHLLQVAYCASRELLLVEQSFSEGAQEGKLRVFRFIDMGFAGLLAKDFAETNVSEVSRAVIKSCSRVFLAGAFGLKELQL